MTFQPRDYQTLFRLLGDPSLYHKYQIPSSTPAPTPSRRAFSPNFDVLETPEKYILEGELPGLSDKSKVIIEFTDAQTLLVRGKTERSTHTNEHTKSLKPTVEDEEEAAKKESAKDTSKKDHSTKYWVSERTIGEFQRSFTFPGAVDLDGVKATLEHGILEIVVPKRVQVGSKRIEIN